MVVDCAAVETGRMLEKYIKVFLSVSATTTFLCVYSIAVAAVEKGYAILFFGRGAAAANHFSCWLRCCCCWCLCCLHHQYWSREVPATVSSFYVSVIYTAMLRTSIAAVVLCYFHFCPLDCDASVMVVDCAAVETGCMLEKYKMVAHLQCYNKRGYIRTWYVYKAVSYTHLTLPTNREV